MYRFAKKNFLWVISVLVVAVAVALMVGYGIDKAAQVSTSVAGFSSALAFLWFVASFRQQTAEIELQRKELGLQRRALENQAKELKNSARFSSMSQIEALLNRATEGIKESNLGITNPADLTSLWVRGMAHWKEMLESRDPNAIMTRYAEWMKIEGLARRYVSIVSTAMKIYFEHHLEIEFDGTKNDDEFVILYQPRTNKAPYLSEHVGPAYLTAQMIFNYGPGLEALLVANMCAASKMFGAGLFKQDAVDAHVADLKKRNITLPAILIA